MTWHEAFMMIPINIDQFQIKYRSVAVELSVRNLPSLVKFVVGWSVGYLLVGWSLWGRMRHLTPPHHSSTQLQLSCSSVQLQIIMPSSFNYSGVTLSPDLLIWALFYFLFVYIEVLFSILIMDILGKSTLPKSIL